MNNIGIQLKWAAIITAFACLWAAMEKALGYHDDFSNIIVTAFFITLFSPFYGRLLLSIKRNHWVKMPFGNLKTH